MFAVFAATILSFVLRPLPMGVCVLIGLVVLAGSGTLGPTAVADWMKTQELGASNIIEVREQTAFGTTVVRYSRDFADSSSLSIVLPNKPFADRLKESLQASLSGFADTTVWLVVAAFLISGAMVHSGLGRRLAAVMVAAAAETTLGLGYAIAAAELLLAPFIPSNTARGGGLMMPIVNSISGVLGSEPYAEPKRAGEYLVLCGAHTNLVTAAMFLTGMAANPLVSRAAKDFLDQDFGWGMWLKGSIVPGLLSLLLVPLVLYWLARPTLTDASEAQQSIRGELKELGRWTPQQITMAIVLLVMLVAWATGPVQEEQWGFKAPNDTGCTGRCGAAHHARRAPL